MDSAIKFLRNTVIVGLVAISLLAVDMVTYDSETGYGAVSKHLPGMNANARVRTLARRG